MDEFGERGLDAVPEKAAEAADALERLKGPAEAAAKAIEASFERAGESLVRSLARAAADGEITMQELARAVLAAISAVAGSGRGGSLGEALSQAVGGAFGGSKADGGMAAPGMAYPVGERGPEVFRPSTAGEIGPVGGAVTVNVAVQGGPERLLRSEAQIAQALVRAMRLGARG